MFDDGIPPIFDVQIPFHNSQDKPLYIIFEPHFHVFILAKSDAGFVRAYADKPQHAPFEISFDGNKIYISWHESVCVEFYRNGLLIDEYSDKLPVDF